MLRKLGTVFLYLVFVLVLGVSLSRLTSRFPGQRGLLLAGTFIVVFVVLFAWRLSVERASQRQVSRGILLMQQGRFSEAVEVMKKPGGGRANKAPLAINLGGALLCLWRLDEAEAAYVRIPRRNARRMGLGPIGMPSLALIHALKGRAAEVERVLAEAEKMNGSTTGLTTLARAVVAARAEKWLETRDFLRRYEVTLLGGPTRALADALSAWAVENTTGEKRHVDPVALFGEGSSAGLKAAWPELVEFVERAPKA